jgi:hypothetical protein
VTYDNQKKARNALLKHKAKMVSVKLGIFGKDDTFVTGGGVPGRKRDQESDEEKEYEFAEDKLIDNVD